jgi:DNA invertase Pin-like site-specific DNA recombinase
MIEAAVARRKARIVSAAGEGTEGDGPSDVLMRRIVDAFAEYERLVIRARTKAALGAKKARRERTGSIPYGVQLAEDGVHLLPLPNEQQAIQLARQLHAQERSLRWISQALG